MHVRIYIIHLTYIAGRYNTWPKLALSSEVCLEMVLFYFFLCTFPPCYTPCVLKQVDAELQNIMQLYVYKLTETGLSTV